MFTEKGAQAKPGLVATFKTIAWSFFGVRRGADHEAETANLNPVYVILAGIVSCALFVLTLVLIVKFVV